MFTGSLVTRIGISNKNLTGTGILKNYQVGNWIEPPPLPSPLEDSLFSNPLKRKCGIEETGDIQ